MLHHPKLKSFDLSSLKYCISGGAPLPIELDLPGAPKRYYEFGPIRFKFILDGKYEFFSVAAKSDRVNITNEVKIDMAAQKASFRTGLKGKLTPNIDAQAIGKLSPDSINHIGLALKDPKKFALGKALGNYLNVPFCELRNKIRNRYDTVLDTE